VRLVFGRRLKAMTAFLHPDLNRAIPPSFLTLNLTTVRGPMAVTMTNIRLPGRVLTHLLVVLAFLWVELHILEARALAVWAFFTFVG
jgi:hypothetical protein